MRRAAAAVGTVLRCAVLLAAFCVLCACAFSGAEARWKAAYAALPADVQSWYDNASVTPAAAARLGFLGCCKYSDVVHAEFRVDRTNGRDEWWWKDGETWRQVPPDIIHWDEHAPDNAPTLFVLAEDFGLAPAGTPTCFFPPGGGS